MKNSNKYDSAVVQYLPQDLRLSEEKNYLSEAEFLEALAQKVAYLLQYNNAVFFQILYKIDILEPKLKAAMQTSDPALSIAKLILERQLESLSSRNSNPAHKAKDKDLEW